MNAVRTIFALALFSMVFLLATLASAQTLPPVSFGFDLEWTDPTERVDATPFDPATEIGVYRAECVRGADWSEAAFVLIERSATGGTGNDRTYFWEDAVTQGGWYNCRFNVADVNGLVSDWSNTITVRKQAVPRAGVLKETGTAQQPDSSR